MRTIHTIPNIKFFLRNYDEKHLLFIDLKPLEDLVQATQDITRDLVSQIMSAFPFG